MGRRAGGLVELEVQERIEAGDRRLVERVLPAGIHGADLERETVAGVRAARAVGVLVHQVPRKVADVRPDPEAVGTEDCLSREVDLVDRRAQVAHAARRDGARGACDRYIRDREAPAAARLEVDRLAEGDRHGVERCRRQVDWLGRRARHDPRARAVQRDDERRRVDALLDAVEAARGDRVRALEQIALRERVGEQRIGRGRGRPQQGFVAIDVNGVAGAGGGDVDRAVGDVRQVVIIQDATVARGAEIHQHGSRDALQQHARFEMLDAAPRLAPSPSSRLAATSLDRLPTGTQTRPQRPQFSGSCWHDRPLSECGNGIGVQPEAASARTTGRRWRVPATANRLGPGPEGPVSIGRNEDMTRPPTAGSCGKPRAKTASRDPHGISGVIYLFSEGLSIGPPRERAGPLGEGAAHRARQAIKASRCRADGLTDVQGPIP